ncbi:Putative assembly protein [Bacillus subtilis QB928]|nr:Putative assembly protein [Bacillus subtilis QB928]
MLQRIFWWILWRRIRKQLRLDRCVIHPIDHCWCYIPILISE